MANTARKKFLILTNEGDEIAKDVEEKKIIREDYIQYPFSVEIPTIEYKAHTIELSGPSITREKIERAIETAKISKAPGPDKVPAKLAQLLDEKGIKILQKLFNKIYDNGHYLAKWNPLQFFIQKE